MSIDIDLLRQSFELVIERQPELTGRFYEILFERYPEVQPLFGRNTRMRQEEMLTQALVAVIDHIEDSGWLSTTLPALGARHVAYGVTDVMYDWVAECLLAAIAEAAGPDFTPAVNKCWSDALRAIAFLMQSGAQGQRPTVSSPARSRSEVPAKPTSSEAIV